MLPIFDVKWGEGDTPPVKVTVLGSTKELLELQINDVSFSKRPLLIITNAMELNSRPNPPVMHLQRPPADQTNSANCALSNAPSPRPPPFRQQVN